MSHPGVPGEMSLDDIEIRELTTAYDLAPLPAFERHIWGGEGDSVSVNLLVATISEGGVALGAFHRDRLVGAVYGFPTREPDVLHSHYMAVEAPYRRIGLAVELKQRQRQWCLDHHITRMRWTYDPLQIANAHLNLHVLGASGVEYHVDHYGTLGGINGVLPSDRLTVSWDLIGGPAKPAATLGVDVPPVTADDVELSTPAAMQARLAVRHALEPRLLDGWTVVDVDRAERRYLLAPPAAPAGGASA